LARSTDRLHEAGARHRATRSTRVVHLGLLVPVLQCTQNHTLVIK
jgi:hypothetical protein